MAKRISASKWFIRIDGNRSFLEEKCKVMTGWIDLEKCLAVYHIGANKENPHLHAIMEMSSVLQKQSFDVRIKKLFEIDKKSSYSTKEWDGNYGHGAGSYLYHEDPDGEPLVNKGFTEIHLDGFRDANKTVQKIVEMNKAKASNKMVEAAVEAWKEAIASEVSDRDICRWMLMACFAGEFHYPGSFMLKRYVEEATLKIKGEKYAEHLTDKLFPL